ncbi:zinc ribbon domain-containing protein [Salinirubellus sp. GCM10025818]|uniref:zinc ribbon domain-containing protein n=1 Tax=Salinirubellus TaxID=2162630 RepID=UPI0030CF97B3
MADSGGSSEPSRMRYDVWRCPECGHEHPKNNPPCDRCGAMRLERVEVTEDDFESELETPSFLDLVAENPLPVVAAALVLSVAAVAVLAGSGVFVLSDPFGLGYRYGAVDAIEPNDDGTFTAGEFRAAVAEDYRVETVRYSGRQLELVYETDATSNEAFTGEVATVAELYARYAASGGEAERLRIVATSDGNRVGRLTVESSWGREFASGDISREAYLSRIAETAGR